MRSFEELEVVETFEPTLELVDGIVGDMHNAHAKPEGGTPWLVPFDIKNRQYLDAVVHAKITLHEEGWKVLAFQRRTGEDAYHYETSAKIYERSEAGLFVDEYTFMRGIYLPRASVFSEFDDKGEHMEELFSFFEKRTLIPKHLAPRGNGGNKTERRQLHRNNRTLQRGGFMMRLWERAYLGEMPNLQS